MVILPNCQTAAQLVAPGYYRTSHEASTKAYGHHSARVESRKVKSRNRKKVVRSKRRKIVEVRPTSEGSRSPSVRRAVALRQEGHVYRRPSATPRPPPG